MGKRKGAKQRKTRFENTERLWSIGRLAHYLGVPVATIYAWCSRGEGPPALRIGRYLRFRFADVETWLASRREQGHTNALPCNS